jgi:hypothetical protein
MEATKRLGGRSGKILVSGIFGVLIAAITCLGCKNAVASGAIDSPVAVDTPDGVLYVAEQVGGEPGSVTSTSIKLTFESEIFDLSEDQIIIEGNVTKGSLDGSGNIWTVELSDVSAQGEVTVLIENKDIEKTQKQVQVYKAGGGTDGGSGDGTSSGGSGDGTDGGGSGGRGDGTDGDGSGGRGDGTDGDGSTDSGGVLPDDGVPPTLVRAVRVSNTALAVKFSKPVTDANKSCFTVTKIGTSETFAVSGASAAGDTVTLTVADVSNTQSNGLKITIANNAVKDLEMRSAVADAIGVLIEGSAFSFTVRVEARQSFEIPVSGGRVGGKPYNWNIDWGDGSVRELASGSSKLLSSGIRHTYAGGGDYQISIRPNLSTGVGSTDAWLVAFGFMGVTIPNVGFSESQSNKDKIISVDSELTLLMTRTQAQINGNTAPDSEWAYTFSGCQNPDFKMGPKFKFAAEWDTVTKVGADFCYNMFTNCSGAAFTMNTVFNLPQNIETIGKGFVAMMFSGCSGVGFRVNDVIKFPRVVGVDAFLYTFDLGDGAAIQTRSAVSIINGVTAPNYESHAFGPAGSWTNYASLAAGWR